MADKKKSGVSVVPEFVDGEQPTADKFNAIGSQLKRAVYVLEKAVGDVWNESDPYAEADDSGLISENRLTLPWGRRIDSSSGSINPVAGADTIGRRLDIVSLARLIGPASNLNPSVLSEGHQSGLSPSEEQIALIEDEYCLHQDDVHELYLRYPPLGFDASGSMPAHSDYPITFSDSVTFSNQVEDIADLDGPGDFMVTRSGRVMLFGNLAGASEDLTVTYYTSPANWGGGPNYIGAGWNVIPDPNQLSNATSASECVTITDAGDGTYMASLPNSVIHQQSDILNASSELDPGYDINANARYKLPMVIRAVCGSSDMDDPDEEGIAGVAIPEGMLYLRNHTTGQLYSDAVYYYNNDTTIQIGNVDLEEEITNGDYFCIITVGTDITSSIDDIRRKVFQHSHDREFGETPVHVRSLAGRTEGSSTNLGGTYKGPYLPSSVPANWFPQYLHREGYTGNDDPNTDRNVMRGNLVIGVQGTADDDSDGKRVGYYQYMNAPTADPADGRDSYKLQLGSSAEDRAPFMMTKGGTRELLISGVEVFEPNAGIEIKSYEDVNLLASSDGSTVWGDTEGIINIAASGTAQIRGDAGSTGADVRLWNIGSGNVNISTASNGDILNYAGGTGGILLDASGTTANTVGNNDVKIVAADNIHSTSSNSMHWTCTDDDADMIFTLPGNGDGPDNESKFIINFDSWAGGDSDGRGLIVCDSAYNDRYNDTFAQITAPNADGQILTVVNSTESAGTHSWTGLMRLRYSRRNAYQCGLRRRTWIDFYASDRAVGRIQSEMADGDSATNKKMAFVIQADCDTNGGVAKRDRDGDIAYVSGSCDFGELVAMGDVNEWQDVYDDPEWKPGGAGERFGLPEGVLVFVRDTFFYRKGPGTPMVVTCRAIVKGNTSPESESVPHEILSFTGQLPVYVRGKVKSGDYLVPSEEIFCIPVSPEEVTFEQYRSAIGVAWGSTSEDHDGSQHRIWTAVGIK